MLNNQIAILQGSIALLDERSQSFAQSLCAQFTRKRSLSDKQVYYVDKLVAEVQAKLAGIPVPAAHPVSVLGNYMPVLAMFAVAATKLKYPKITLRLFDSVQSHVYQDIRLSVAGSRSSKPGWLNITSADSYGDREWYGRVSPEGVFEQGRAFDARISTLLMPVLAELGTNPRSVIVKHGAMTGHCCFCNLELTDEKSKNAGFGFKCAQNYNLVAEYKAATHVI